MNIFECANLTRTKILLWYYNTFSGAYNAGNSFDVIRCHPNVFHIQRHSIRIERIEPCLWNSCAMAAVYNIKPFHLLTVKGLNPTW